MKKEKFILSFVAALVGLLVAVLVFFFYQSSKKIDPDKLKTITINTPSPTPKSSVFLSVDKPTDEEVVEKRTVSVTGKTTPGAKILVVTQSDQQAAVPTSDGSFSTDITIDAGENVIEITALAPNGEEVKIRRIVTFSTETF